MQLLSRFKVALAENAPSLGTYKRVASALWQASTPTRPFYGQHGEDRFLLERLSQYRLDQGIYVDVGANHPMTLSNTYLLYRAGLNGVIVEPIAELARLHRLFRSRDRVVCVACGNRAQLVEFQVAKAPVLSSIGGLEERQVWRTELVPVLTLDMLLSTISTEFVYLLNIDAEGHNYEVLQGAESSLARVMLVCVEATDADEKQIREYLEARAFSEVARIGCNLVFENRGADFSRFEQKPFE